MKRNQNPSAIRRYLDTLNSLRGAHTLVSQYGRAYPVTSGTFVGGGKPGMCYMNAALRAIQNDHLTYVEGFINLFGVPISHAWLDDGSGNAVDPTLSNGDGIIEYFGVPVRTSWMTRCLVGKGTYGMFFYDNRRELENIDPALAFKL